MEDQTQHDDESYNQDNVGTGAEISTENDVLAPLNDGFASANFHDDGAPSSAPSVALESPFAAHEQRSSTIPPRKEESSLPGQMSVFPFGSFFGPISIDF